MSIRKLTEKDLKKAGELAYYCFGTGQDPWPEEEIKQYNDTYNLEYCLGYFDGDELVSTWIVFPWEIFIRGSILKFGGVADVTTQPEYRRRGQIRELFLYSLKQMKDNGIIISALSPFKYSYYEMFGYEICTESRILKTNPKEIILPGDFTLLKVKEIKKDESFEKLIKIRNQVGKNYTLIKIPDKKTWNIRKFTKEDKIIGIFDENSTIVGYIIYRLKKLPSGDWDIAIVIREMITISRDAFYTALDYIKKHGDQIMEFQIPLLDNELTFSNFYEKDNVKIETKSHDMFRIVDVKKCIEAINYDKKIDTTFTLCINDKHAEWNNGSFIITIKNCKAQVERKEVTDIDLEIDINSFTQLFTGYQSIEQIVYRAKAKVKKEKMKIINDIYPICPTRILTHF
ncbi:MAG: enhanced intracellular survival protein Eis [Candidatus Thorarchaeota archaeon]